MPLLPPCWVHHEQYSVRAIRAASATSFLTRRSSGEPVISVVISAWFVMFLPAFVGSHWQELSVHGVWLAEVACRNGWCGYEPG